MKKGPDTDKIRKMFDTIAPDYDRLNHLLSLGIDRIWRKKALKEIAAKGCPCKVLDIACGTGDFSIGIAGHCGPGSFVQGLDLSEGMLEVMKRKVDAAGLSEIVRGSVGNCESLPFGDNLFDVASIGFGIRNFEHRERALVEIARVLKPGGRLVILELSLPSAPIVRQLYGFYFTKILPRVGGCFSGDRAAYRYLPASVVNFPNKEEWMAIMEACGFSRVRHRAFTFGICRMYIGEK